MQDARSLLDEAYDIGVREKELLVEGDSDQAGELARERGALIYSAIEMKDETCEGDLCFKLHKLRSQQSELIAEAARLREELRVNLTKIKQENTRLSGYGKVVKPVARHTRFLSKKG